VDCYLFFVGVICAFIREETADKARTNDLQMSSTIVYFRKLTPRHLLRGGRYNIHSRLFELLLFQVII